MSRGKPPDGPPGLNEPVGPTSVWAQVALDICERARQLGCDLAATTPLRTAQEQAQLRHHLEQLAARGLLSHFLPGPPEQHVNPQAILAGARSLVAVALSYHGPTPPPPADLSGRGRIARYAWGADYHPLLRARLRTLADELSHIVAKHVPDAPHVQTQVLVDTGTLLDRDAAVAAGLGWIGKNGCLIHPRYGSYLLLGELVTNLPLPSLTPPMPNRCGSCQRCREACPTQALVSPGVLAANRCLSEWTQRPGLPPPAICRALGRQLFGCDICQDVCPWNRRARYGQNPALWATDADTAYPRLAAVIAMSNAEFQQQWAGRAAGWRGKNVLVRNAVIALGNHCAADAQTLPLLRAAARHASPSVRQAAAWAAHRLLGSG